MEVRRQYQGEGENKNARPGNIFVQTAPPNTPCIYPNVVLICACPTGATMPIIKSISSLRHRTREIASICRKKDEPVYLTTNGEGDLVVMTIDHYERLKAQVDLFEKLGVAQIQSAAGKKGITHRQMMTKLRRRVNAR
jgi:prevent-host-death family protein